MSCSKQIPASECHSALTVFLLFQTPILEPNVTYVAADVTENREVSNTATIMPLFNLFCSFYKNQAEKFSKTNCCLWALY